jgi:hypothetical protein
MYKILVIIRATGSSGNKSITSQQFEFDTETQAEIALSCLTAAKLNEATIVALW